MYFLTMATILFVIAWLNQPRSTYTLRVDPVTLVAVILWFAVVGSIPGGGQ